MNAASSRFASLLLLGALGMVASTASGMGNSSRPSQSVSVFDSSAEFQKGMDALKANKFDEAEHSFKRVLEDSPNDANTNFMMGMAESGLGKNDDARKYYEKAVRYDDGLILAHMELGLTLVKLGQNDKAGAVLDDLKKRAAACADTCPQAKDLQSAVSTLGSALAPATSPASPASPATSQVPVTQELLTASVASGDRAYLDAVALINQKRYEEAIVALDASARVFGPHPDILTYLGYANRKLGRYDVAVDYYRQALAAAPNHLGATEYYGELMVERGDLDGARKMLAKLDNVCHFGCAQADELRRWVVAGKPPSS